MLKKKKVRAGVLLYALVMAGIFSLLLQFYLNRQVAYHQDYVLNKEKLVAYAMAKRTYEKATSENGEQSFNVGKSTYRNDEKFFTTTISTEKNQFEFRFPPLKKTDDKTKKTEKKSKEGSEEKKEEQVKKEMAMSSKLAPSKNGTE
ncbi:competence type IV pilus minor pilin ComGG [Streptococcus sp. DTU_2020_1001019_1_SI_AUS_MUR_006]|uniref:competence type IV pilus minor pilin ComGG n=1 Tax=Streptococcus sp. DTU_2020_1001019_1_SI_AUS_MUR_006 TaxID=3077584 RepID=UPI0028EE4AED|nr:competence type IV pilus minor pilin ComGG [Streptococcus sp. DTU_2020_1001019_1_SI_AUS_MUR_006]WNS73100.1 competence type IV pilus minor pilin ComGG [Streptococcus sp. DTU_2020_1001019_1_SI_AUS_MUR_006]